LENEELMRLRGAFETSVYLRMMSDVPYGVLLSGGLDSSLVAAIANRRYLEIMGKPIMSFSIGLKHCSPDLVAAKKAANFLGRSTTRSPLLSAMALTRCRQLSGTLRHTT
jgi:asparagine synthase (glutamine-hydrolysing)